MKYRVLGLLISFVFLVVMTGCSSLDEKIVGKWEDDELGFVIYEFSSDGKMVIEAIDETIKGEFKTDGDELVIEANGEKQTVKYSIKKNKLTLKNGDADTLVLVKVDKNKKSNTAAEKDNKKSETASATPKETEKEKRTLAPKLELYKRNIELIKNEKGRVSYLGDTSDETGFTFALKYEGDMKFADKSKANFRFIFDDGTDLDINLFDGSERIQAAGDDEIHIITREGQMGDKKLKRIDYILDPSDNPYEEEEKPTTLAIKDTTEKITIPALNSIKKLTIPLKQTYEDEEKTISLSEVTLDDTDGNIRLIGEVIFKEDGKGLAARSYRPINQVTSEGQIETSNDEFFAEIPVDFTIEFSTNQMIGDDDGAEIYFEINDALFPIDLRTGKKIEKQLSLTRFFAEENGGYLDEIPYKGIQLNNDEVVYNVLSSSYPFWNYGIGTKEKGTIPFILGENYKTFNFTLASGKEKADLGATYDVYVYGDDFETIHDSDEVKGKVLYHQTISSTDDPQDVSVNVEGVNRLYIYYNSNNIAGGSEDEKRLQLLVVNPTLE